MRPPAAPKLNGYIDVTISLSRAAEGFATVTLEQAHRQAHRPEAPACQAHAQWGQKHDSVFEHRVQLQADAEKQRGRAEALRMKCSVSTGQMAQPGWPGRHQASAAWRCSRRARSRCFSPSCPVSVASIVASAPSGSAPRFCSRPARQSSGVGIQRAAKVCHFALLHAQPRISGCLNRRVHARRVCAPLLYQPYAMNVTFRESPAPSCPVSIASIAMSLPSLYSCKSASQHIPSVCHRNSKPS